MSWCYGAVLNFPNLLSYFIHVVKALLLLQNAQTICGAPPYPAHNAHRSSFSEDKADVNEAANSPDSVSTLRMSGVLTPVP